MKVIVHSFLFLSLGDVPLLPIPLPISLRTLLTHYLDFLSPPRRFFYELMRFFCRQGENEEKDEGEGEIPRFELERQKLDFFCTKEGYDELFVLSFFSSFAPRPLLKFFRSPLILHLELLSPLPLSTSSLLPTRK